MSPYVGVRWQIYGRVTGALGTYISNFRCNVCRLIYLSHLTYKLCCNLVKCDKLSYYRYTHRTLSFYYLTSSFILISSVDHVYLKKSGRDTSICQSYKYQLPQHHYLPTHVIHKGDSHLKLAFVALYKSCLGQYPLILPWRTAFCLWPSWYM